jgi:hypothetical protein
MRQKESMQIVFGGQESQIDSNTLINALVHYNSIIAVTNQEFGKGNRNVNVKINAIEKGSFIIDLSLNESLTTLFSAENIAYISGLVTIVGGVFAAYKYYKGRRIKENENTDNFIGEIEIEGNNNTINQTIINVYNQPVVREAISKTIENVNDDNGIESVTIASKRNKKPVIFERKDFEDYIYNDFDAENEIPDQRNNIVDAILTIIKLSFEGGATWQFLYNGFKISMPIKDSSALIDIINKGERFGKGDAISVKMQITQKYNPVLMGYENKSYKIIEFKSHIISSKQSNITYETE